MKIATLPLFYSNLNGQKQLVFAAMTVFFFVFVSVAANGQALECPIKQKPVSNGARPDVELFKKIIRCAKGEKSVAAGDEGAVGGVVCSDRV